MTLQEIEIELIKLRNREEARQRNWRSLRKAAGFCGLFFVLGGAGLLLFSALHGGGRETFQSAIMLILLSIPLSLLGAALA